MSDSPPSMRSAFAPVSFVRMRLRARATTGRLLTSTRLGAGSRRFELNRQTGTVHHHC